MIPNILYEDKDIIVCIKPTGTPTQSSRIGTPDMVSILKNHIHKNGNPKQEPYLAVIHRLDQPVEGILVFAKSPISAKILNKQLTQYGFGKHYRALLIGTPIPAEGDLTDYIVKDGKSNTSRICPPDTPGAKKATLHYKVLQSAPPYSLAEITLQTGRHHQIRVQMAHLGCPIAGDRKYGAASYEANTGDISCQTLKLFACRLTFKHPQTGKEMKFELDRLTSI